MSLQLGAVDRNDPSILFAAQAADLDNSFVAFIPVEFIVNNGFLSWLFFNLQKYDFFQ